MIQALRKHVAAGRRYLVIDGESQTVTLGTVDALVDPARPLTVYELGRALHSFDQLADASEFRFWELCQIGAMSPSLLDKWLADGLVSASVKPSRGAGRGNERIFSRDDAFLVGVLGALRRQGMPPTTLKATSVFLCSIQPAHEVAEVN